MRSNGSASQVVERSFGYRSEEQELIRKDGERLTAIKQEPAWSDAPRSLPVVKVEPTIYDKLGNVA
ncbi:MAG TPA: hypothetical protein VKW09_00010 [bacterium]|nr:hypothetical protein [bacterium]